MSLRVVHVVDSLQLGGTETQSVALVHSLAARGVSNHVVYFQPGPLLARLEAPGVTAERLHVDSFLGRGFVGLLRRLVRVLRERQADVVQSYGFYTNLPALLAGRIAGVRVLVASRRGFATDLRPAQHRVDRLVRRLAHYTVVNAHAIRARLIEDEGARADTVVVIPNCVVERGPIVPVHDAIVGMVANLRPPKDHATFLRAAARVVEIVPTAEFHLVGEGPDELAQRGGSIDPEEFHCASLPRAPARARLCRLWPDGRPVEGHSSSVRTVASCSNERNTESWSSARWRTMTSVQPEACRPASASAARPGPPTTSADRSKPR